MPAWGLRYLKADQIELYLAHLQKSENYMLAKDH